MTNTVPFRTRARTVDHLGREQIADCPTAVSELWKNAYDAYATSVELHIFDGDPVVAAIVDDGHGMTMQEFIDHWLVIGTESKAEENKEVPEEDRNGLPLRVRQGQKGIGRLSVAALGHLTLVLSKRRGKPFMASLVDWRLFKNPYLNLEDIFIPVEEFDEPSDEGFQELIAGMLEALIDNVWGRNGSKERNTRVEDAWKRHDANSTRDEPSESTQIAEVALRTSITTRHLEIWRAWTQEAEHGTALYVIQASPELAIWTKSPSGDDRQQQAAREAKDLLHETLTGFTDALSSTKLPFNYRAIVHRSNTQENIVETEFEFDLEEFHKLEHYVEGEFDRYGNFAGTIRTYLREPEPFSLPSSLVLPQKKTEGYIGPFKFCIGTFEVEPANSKHTREHHAMLHENAQKYGGIAMYRDGLRVMPYGRPDSDFLELEERRSRHAGRYFWAHRRSFGRVAITRQDNPNLRDKAGREGLIDNEARRRLRVLVIDLLNYTAFKYFGTDSETRKEYLPEIRALNQEAKAAEEKASKRRKKAFTEAIRKNTGVLDESLASMRQLIEELHRTTQEPKPTQLSTFDSRLGDMLARKAALRLPPKPASMGKLEEAYRSYRDRYGEFCSAVDQARSEWHEAVEKFNLRSPDEQARSALGRHQEFLRETITSWESSINGLFNRETKKLTEQANKDRSRYYAEVAPLLSELADRKIRLAEVLNRLEAVREDLYQEFVRRYQSYHGAVAQLAEDINIDAALSWSSDQRSTMERQLEQMNSLAQLGITVEIINHELYQLDAEVGRNLRRLPKEVQNSKEYQLAMTAHRALFDRLRFLAPIKLSGPKLREEITGESTFNYLSEFFVNQIQARRVSFVATDAFKAITLSEYPSRIYPVFVNLVSNALYWVTLDKNGANREICLDVVGDDVIVADSGPGIDRDDIEHLFQLFFTRRVEGRGVGLYLCRVNLALGDHTIEYATEERHRVLKGANFVIHFRGLKHGKRS